MGTRRQFGREFKIEAVKLVTERGVPTFKFITGKRSLKFRFSHRVEGHRACAFGVLSPCAASSHKSSRHLNG